MAEETANEHGFIETAPDGVPSVPKSTVLRLRGLPFSAGEDDVRQFFADFEVATVVIGKRAGRSTGEGYVQLDSVAAAADAIAKLHRQTLGHRYIEVFESTEADLATAKSLSVDRMRGFVIRCRGLPYTSTAQDVLNFFGADVPIVRGIEGVVFTYAPDGRPTGEAFVELQTEEAQREALKKHKESLGSRYIELFVSTKVDMIQAIQQNRMQQHYGNMDDVTDMMAGFNMGGHVQMIGPGGQMLPPGTYQLEGYQSRPPPSGGVAPPMPPLPPAARQTAQVVPVAGGNAAGSSGAGGEGQGVAPGSYTLTNVMQVPGSGWRRGGGWAAGHLGPALSADRRNPESEQEARHQGNTPGAACQAGASGRARALWYGREAAAPLADNNACVRTSSMFSVKEVATAFNAAAKALGVDGRELDVLLASLISLSEEELAFFPIGANNKAIIQFVRSLSKSKGAAAGLGKESAPGAGGGGGYSSLKATRMMKALHSMQELPGPGEVLKLDVSFLLHPEYDSVFVRECYPRLFDALVRHPKPRKYIVTGTPGIGVTWFSYYLLARLVNSTAPPPFIVWEHMTKPGMAWCYTHKTREVVIGERTSFDDELDNPATWYIADGVPPQLDCLARIVLLTPPERKIFKEMRKEAAEMLYMPV
eukprot:XP_001692797.1 splicing factor [Chlamydomonas reinhardtii]